MLDKFIFENHLGQRFEGLPNGVYLNQSELRDYSWSFDTINSRISRFYRGITSRKIPLVVYCNSDAEAVSVMNRLHELAEADIVAKIPGKIFVGDYYTIGYITASVKSNYLIRKKYCRIELTLTSDDPVWYNEHAYTFLSENSNADPEPITVKYAEGANIATNDSSDGIVKGLTLYGKTTQDGTPTPEAPVELVSAGNSGAINTTVCGANLINKNNLNYSSTNGGTFSINGEVITGSSKAEWGQFSSKRVPAIPGATMYLSCKSITGGNNPFIRCCYEDARGTLTNFGTTVKSAGKYAVTVPDAAVKVCVRIYINGTANALAELVEASFDSVMLSYADIDYEPYKEVQTLTASTPNGLPGIPVSSGGNYTDENGQQWICDGIDFARGKYIKRICTITPQKVISSFLSTSTGLRIGRVTEKNSTLTPVNNNTIGAVLCDSLPVISANDQWKSQQSTISVSVSDGCVLVCFEGVTTADDFDAILAEKNITVLYAIATPIETPLSAEEMKAYSALRTNKQNTTVYNDSNAYMAIGYYPLIENVYEKPDTDADSSYFGGGADYPYDLPYDYALSVNGRKIVCGSVDSSAFRLLIYGEATNPTVIINGHAYAISGTIAKGETLLIDSLNKTITLTTAAGNKVNWFDKRGRDGYIFEPIPAGQNTVTWSGAFGFDLTVVEKRSEPKWT